MVKKKEDENKGALQLVADRLCVKPDELKSTIQKTIAPDLKTDEQFLAFIAVANAYKLNPLRNEIYAFSKGGSVKPIVPIDGWISIINKQKDLDGIETIENKDDSDKVISITCKIHHKSRKIPTVITEYMNECKKSTSTVWTQWPIRMLRHKAMIQCARIAFGISGIYDEDEGDRIKSVEIVEAKVVPELRKPQALSSEPPADTTANLGSPPKQSSPKKEKTTTDEPRHDSESFQEAEEITEELIEIDVEFVNKLASSSMLKGVSQNEEIKKSFKIMHLALGKDDFTNTLELFGLKSIGAIKSPAMAKMILQLMVKKATK